MYSVFKELIRAFRIIHICKVSDKHIIMHAYTAIQITCSTIRHSDKIPTISDRESMPDSTRIPISSGTYCDIIKVTGDHGIYHIKGTTDTWVFALLIGPKCKTLLLQLDTHISSIVPMFISMACRETTITIQSLRHVFAVETRNLSPRVLPYIMCSTRDVVTMDMIIIVPTLESRQIVESCHHAVRTWDCLMLSRETRCTVAGISGSVSAMYDFMATKLLHGMSDLKKILNPTDDSVHTTYTSIYEFSNLFQSLVSKARKQAEHLKQLQDLLATYGYVMAEESVFEFDIASMFKSNVKIDVSY
jgi:hypothetical protein